VPPVCGRGVADAVDVALGVVPGSDESAGLAVAGPVVAGSVDPGDSVDAGFAVGLGVALTGFGVGFGEGLRRLGSPREGGERGGGDEGQYPDAQALFERHAVLSTRLY